MTSARAIRTLSTALTVVGLLAVCLPNSTGAAASSTKPNASLVGTYLISLYPNVKNPPILVEIVRPTGQVVRVVERTSFGEFGYGRATWSPNGKMLAWLDAHGLNVENSDGSD